MISSICPKCKGKGKILVASRQTGYDQVEVTCKMCKGSGKK